jgi:predicted RNase H-like nuclease (RuvC/YqgF family)
LEVKKALLGKEAYEKIVVGIDPGEAIGFAVIADGKVIEESNCYTNREVIRAILKILKQ